MERTPKKGGLFWFSSKLGGKSSLWAALILGVIGAIEWPCCSCIHRLTDGRNDEAESQEGDDDDVFHDQSHADEDAHRPVQVVPLGVVRIDGQEGIRDADNNERHGEGGAFKDLCMEWR